jgi:hypothetical protein
METVRYNVDYNVMLPCKCAVVRRRDDTNYPPPPLSRPTR